MVKRRVDGHVYLYRAGMTVFWGGGSYIIENNVVRDGALLLKIYGFTELVPATHVKVDPTYYSIQTDINDPD
jgi:hypothetical protein